MKQLRKADAAFNQTARQERSLPHSFLGRLESGP
jgi:hypothetical protein